MSGVNEILLIAAIVAGIFLVPRMMPAKRQLQIVRQPVVISAKMRVAIAASIVYPVAAAAYFQPWKTDPVLFVYVGLGPVALGWLLRWVVAGLKKR